MFSSRLFLPLCLAIVAAQPIAAQRTTATLLGLAQDPSQAAIPNAAVVLRDEATGAQRSAQTNERGEFTLGFLPPGAYTIEVKAAGFKAFTQTLRLSAGDQVRFPVTLEIGAASEQVTVTEEAALLQDASPALNDRLNRQQIAELPQSRRDFTQLLLLQPGVRASSAGLFSFNGLAPGGSNVTVDGVDGAGDVETPSTSMFNNFNFINVMSQEAIGEVSVSKGVYGADVGRTFGGNINLITRGGTNEFHGSLFENWQNDVLNARFALLAPTARKPPVRFHQFGGSFGGAIVKDKLFFFGVYEGYRQSSFVNIIGQVPTPELKAQAIARVPAYQQMFSLWPDPTDPYPANAVTGVRRTTGSNTANDDHAVARVDYRITDRYLLTGRYRRGRPDQSIPSIIPTNPRTFVGISESGSLTLTRASAGWTGETRYGINLNDALRAELLHTNGNIPALAVQGQFSSGAETLLNRGYSWSIEQVMQRVFGRHVIKFGGIYFGRHPRRFNEEVPIFTYPNVQALFDNRPSAIRVTFGQPNYKGKAWEMGYFLQDDFRVRPNLTINLGLRYEYFSVYRDLAGFLNNPDGPDGAVQVPPRFRPQDRIYEPDRNNFAPRVGLAWSIGKENRNVIRAGAGVAYAPFNLRTFASSHYINPSLPFRFNLGPVEISQFNLRYPFTNDQFAAFVTNTVAPRGYVTTYPKIQNPQNYQWSFDYQRRITSSISFQTGYVGNKANYVQMTHSRNLPDWNTGIRPAPQALSFTYRDDADFSYYHSWQSSLRKRFQSGLSLNAHYTWSRVMAVSNGDFWLGNDLNVQDETNWRADLGPTAFDAPHVFAADFLYELPLARVAKARGFWKHLTGGWQIAGIYTASSGTPFSVTQSSNRPSSRPDAGTGPAYADGSDRFQWLNRAAFVLVPIPAASGGTARPGNISKNGFRAPARWNVDLALSKNFRFGDRFGLQIRADAFNAFNTVIRNAPVADVRNAAFGRILSVSEARRGQLNAKFTF